MEHQFNVLIFLFEQFKFCFGIEINKMQWQMFKIVITKI